MEKLKIVFVGTPDMALVCLDRLLDEKFNIVTVVPPQKSHATYTLFKNFINDKSLNFIDFDKTPNERECIEKVKSLNADIGVVCSYNIKLSQDFLNTTKMGYINCHPSLLPEYRGAMPYFHIINNNEKTSGITLHYMDSDFDTGDIIYQKEFEILDTETMGTLFNRTNYMFGEALVKVLSDIQNGVQINTHPQEKDKTYKTAPYTKEFYKINWYKDCNQIDSLIRACNPFYSAYSYFRGIYTKIIKAHKIDTEHNFQPGKIVEATKDKLIVASQKGLISIDVLQLSSWGIFLPEDFYQIFKPTQEEYLK